MIIPSNFVLIMLCLLALFVFNIDISKLFILLIRFCNTVRYRYSQANEVVVVVVCKRLLLLAPGSLRAGAEGFRQIDLSLKQS